MPGPIAIGSAIGRMSREVTIRCPWCRHEKQVENRPAAFRVCPRCHKQFPDPLTKYTKKR